MTFELYRCTESAQGTFGMIVDNFGIPVVLTLELPWLENKKQVSCIPAGRYQCKRHPRGYSVLKVPGRDGILIHSGNTIDDIKGCILVGMSIGSYNGKAAVLKSSEGLNRLIQVLGDEFILDVMPVKLMYYDHANPRIPF